MVCGYCIRHGGFRSTGSYEPDQEIRAAVGRIFGFDPQALTSLTAVAAMEKGAAGLFRSTGSYEPDRSHHSRTYSASMFRSTGSYEPDRILYHPLPRFAHLFRSTGSYEPDPAWAGNTPFLNWLFRSTGSYEPDLSKVLSHFGNRQVSIHRLLRA